VEVNPHGLTKIKAQTWMTELLLVRPVDVRPAPQQHMYMDQEAPYVLVSVSTHSQYHMQSIKHYQALALA
jgi:hypothetical protein